MALDRTNITPTDDSGSGTDGTIADAAWVANLADKIDAAIDGADATVRTVAKGGTGLTALGTALYVLRVNAGATALEFAAPSTVVPGVCEGRLTLTSGTPVTTADVTAATNVYWTPYKGKYTALYDGASAWVLRAFAETTLALGTLTSGLPYDIFAYDNGGTLALEALAWTNGTTRATALTLQDGVLVKTGATTRRYLGTFRTTATTTTEDSKAKRLLFNYYNQVPRPLEVLETAGAWTYTTASWRQANANAANQVEVMIGVQQQAVDVAVYSVVGNSGGSVFVGGGIALDGTGGPTAGCLGPTFYTQVAGVNIGNLCTERVMVGLGYHFLAWIEYSTASGTSTWVGTGVHSGIVGQVWA